MTYYKRITINIKTQKEYNKMIKIINQQTKKQEINFENLKNTITILNNNQKKEQTEKQQTKQQTNQNIVKISTPLLIIINFIIIAILIIIFIKT